MNDFLDVEISELGHTITGKTPSSREPEDFGSKYMFVTPSDNWDNKVVSSTSRYLSDVGYEKLVKKALPPNSVLVSCIGSAMGRVVMNASECVTNQQINSIIVNTANFSSDYVYYKLVNEYKNLRIAASGSTSLPLLNKTDFDRIKIKVHEEFGVQNNIAKILSDLDSKIELNNKINSELEAMAKLIYDYWFVQFDFPDENGRPYKSSGGKMVYNEELKREIPEGWEIKGLVEEMNVQYGYPFSTKLFSEEPSGKPVIRIRDILENTISIYSTEETDDKYKLAKKDLVIGMDGNFHMNFWINNSCWLNQRCVRIREIRNSRASIYQAYRDIKPYIEAREKNVSRTTVGHLSAKDINGLKILIAPETEKFKHRGIFDSLLNKIIANRIENIELSKLRDWLLPMLMNGQVTVGEAEKYVFNNLENLVSN